jgi:hypothetical protein
VRILSEDITMRLAGTAYYREEFTL